MKCNDTRPCFARREGECLVLEGQEYPTGKCPFCKPYRDRPKTALAGFWRISEFRKKRWIMKTDNIMVCSECGGRFGKADWRFCPNCGAKMGDVR